ncbi:MAG: RidA family protein [Planctomycetota bacterium]|jgi:enamine deaminase RidA (YjgF/YER057c/UK114 family)
METKSDTFETRTLDRCGGQEYWINSVENHECGGSVIQNAADYLKALGVRAVSLRLFGNRVDVEQACRFVRSLPDKNLCPPLAMIEKDNAPSPLQVQIHAVAGMRSEALYFEDTFVGRKFEDDSAVYTMLTISPDSPREGKYAQTKETFEKAHKILASFGLGFSHTIRTWLYAADILSWYDELNRARNEFFTAQGIYDRLVPASTGVGLANPAGTALAMQVLAVDVKSNDMRIQAAQSPLQNPAMDYKSSFSRGVQLLAPDHQRLSVSGTASIDKDGRTVFVGDAAAQVDLTMRVASAILDNARMEWSDTVSGLVYFKRRDDFALFDAYCRKHEIALPHVKICADVCRDDLLFELELDAVKQ